MILSIIVPVYNVEDYLEKCIESLYKQDLPKHEYEVIAVNDGSTDKSLDVLERLKQKHASVKIITQENQGLSGARNTGINNASGDYILFVDSDDYILENTAKKLTDLAQQNDLDILEFGADGVAEDGTLVYSGKSSSNNKVLPGEQYLHEIRYMGSACNKMYAKAFLNTNNLRFMRGVYIEDIEFNTRAVFKAKRVMAIDDTIAHFLQRDGSITRTNNLKKTKKMIYDIHTVLTSIDTFNENEIGSQSVAYIPMKKRVCALVTTMLLRVLTGINDYAIKKDIFTKLKSQNLYPIPYATEDPRKDKFRIFANQNWLFSLVCKFYCFKNK
jgi:glycosyltransferase involved in cell wall biosynthesis